MGSGEDSAPVKPSKQTAPIQETPPTPAYSDWSASMQAYYSSGATPPAFFTSTVPSSPSPHPYMYQHFIPPYGAPLPYHPMYYAHPNMAVAPSAAPITTETEGKVPNGKGQSSKKKSKGSSGNTGPGGKSGENGKAASGSGNDGGASQSAESGSDGSSDASDENTNQKDVTKKRSFHQILADGANAPNTTQLGGVDIEASSSARGQPAINAPLPVPGQIATTNLNIGMDLWNATSAGAVPMKPRLNAPGVSQTTAPPTMVGCEGVPEHLWIQDERELKRQRRKQSNRESARRSRLRKQAECEELQAKVERLGNENQLLKEELTRLSEECVNLTKDNESVMEQVKRMYGPEAISGFEIVHHSQLEENHNAESSRGSDAAPSDQDENFFKPN